MYKAAANCKDIARTPVTNWESHGVTPAGYCHAARHGMKVQLVTPYRVSHLQRYGIRVRGKVTCVYPPLCQAEFDFKPTNLSHTKIRVGRCL